MWSGFVNYFTLHIHNMQSSGSSHQSHWLSEQQGEQPRDEGEVGKIHGGRELRRVAHFPPFCDTVPARQNNHQRLLGRWLCAFKGEKGLITWTINLIIWACRLLLCNLLYFLWICFRRQYCVLYNILIIISASLAEGSTSGGNITSRESPDVHPPPPAADPSRQTRRSRESKQDY